MLDTLKMWLFGLPYALWQTQWIKVVAQRFWEAAPLYEWGVFWKPETMDDFVEVQKAVYSTLFVDPNDWN